MATITDVAAAAGVSVKTVSRVLNDYPHVHKQTREKVNAAIAALNYAPSAAARQMRLGNSLAVGMLYADSVGGYQSKLNDALLRACAAHGRYLAADAFDESGGDWDRQLVRFVEKTQVQDMILVPPLCDSTILHDVLAERGMRFTLVSPSRAVSYANIVSMDDQLAAREMTEHLLALGHRRIAHISGHPDHVASLHRRRGFEEAMMRRADAPYEETCVRQGSFRFQQALAVAEELLSRRPRPTAIFAANDDMAAAVCLTTHKLGLRIPDDVSVAGFDDAAIAMTTWPPLTTIAQPFDAIARTAVGMLTRSKDRAQREGHLSRVLPHRLIVRGSTGPAPPL